jgi:hypothetical protein
LIYLKAGKKGRGTATLCNHKKKDVFGLKFLGTHRGLSFTLFMTVPDTDTDHRHLDHPSVNGAVTHYSGGGSDEATDEHRSMFARAFQKVRLCHVNVEFWLSYQTQTQ